MWRLDADRALVFTTDFITPVVDDARSWGRIAAANAVSDVYAMGGRPLLALNLVAWNDDELPLDLLSEVLEGGIDVATDAGFLVVGGHTVDDPEPKYGMAVIGEADPDRLLTNAGLLPGQALVLTKPLGIGIVTTAIKAGRAPEPLIDRAIASMVRTNAEAAAVALELGATGATDVTGFGLLGHAGRMASESGVDLSFDAGSVPFIDGSGDLAAEGIVPGGTRRNLAFVDERLDRAGVSDLTVMLLADAQTSGGLLFGVDAERADEAVSRLAGTGHDAAIVGEAHEGTGQLRFRP